jgi:Family of unknown function (DUF6338)
MPATVDAALIFAVLVLPGYLLGKGIGHGRRADSPGPDLHVLAQAVFASLIWLFFTYWWAIDDLIRWVDDGALGDHSTFAGVWRSSVLVLAPYFVGRALGMAVEQDLPIVAPILRWLGIGAPFGTPWDVAWDQVEDAQAPILVTVTFSDGRKLAGQFAEDSRASVSPQPPELYLEEAYETTDDGQIVVYDQGAHIDGSKIVAIAFKSL